MFFFPSAVITGALTSLLFPSSSGRFIDFFRVLIPPPTPRVPQFSPPGKVQPRREPCRTFQSASLRNPYPHPTPPPSIMPQLLTASMELISQMRFLSWSMICFSCWFFCLSFCKERKTGTIADRVNDFRQTVRKTVFSSGKELFTLPG